jgi:hypothetical protein
MNCWIGLDAQALALNPGPPILAHQLGPGAEIPDYGLTDRQRP